MNTLRSYALGAALIITPAIEGCTEPNELAQGKQDGGGTIDAMITDMGGKLDVALPPDAGVPDAITQDSLILDASISDVSVSDTAVPDVSVPDTGAADVFVPEERLCPNGELPVGEDFDSKDDVNCDGINAVPAGQYAVVCDNQRSFAINVTPDSNGAQIPCPDNFGGNQDDVFISLNRNDGVETRVITTADGEGEALVMIVRPINGAEMGPATATNENGGVSPIDGQFCFPPTPGDQYAALCYRTTTVSGGQAVFMIGDPVQ